ncbi:MAG: PadR family transcriptional regulator, partial [Myxococcales bacterium]|nr:PadR family transcriptional regulator [Myxococcales bacterium]
MSLADHRELLVLGTLAAHPLHGYALVEVLEDGLGQALGLKRPAAYAVLKRLEARGWIEAREEREGHLPPRAVYSVTTAGAAALPGLVVACATGPWDTQVPLAPLLVHLDAIEPGERSVLIAGLLEVGRAALAGLERFQGHDGLAGAAFELLARQARLEVEVLEGLL